MNKLLAKESGIRWLWLALLAFALDIGSKMLVMDNMEYGWSHRIEITPFFNLLYVHNYGAAFSFLSDAGGWQRWFFSVMALGVSGLLVYWMRQLPATNKILNCAYALVIGGALGNLYDRLVYGYVVDFLDFYVQDYHWPAFNFADSFICIGAGLIILDSFRPDNKTEIKKTDE